jgi:hypothetical protein
LPRRYLSHIELERPRVENVWVRFEADAGSGRYGLGLRALAVEVIASDLRGCNIA